MKSILEAGLRVGLLTLSAYAANGAERPNIILMMADDLGYGDVGFNGNKIIKTPNLDRMAKAGATLTNFHAGGPVCSPTRGTCLTGRHYYRYGIFTANVGHLPRGEITVSEMLKEQGYTTGHFGKWHLGTLSKTVSAKGEKRKPLENYSPPAEHGYDRSFVAESATGTWDPGYGKRAKNNPFYDDGVVLEANGKNNLKGGDGRVIMDRAIPFIRTAVESDKPFFAVIWFHAPHADVIAGPKYLKMYSKYPEGAQHYYGCITELDEQVGRLRQELKELGVANNTMLWFTSDNGPEGKMGSTGTGRNCGSTDGMRGRKRALFEGGVRVPSLVEWAGHVTPGSVNKTLMSTLDYFPTIQELVGYKMPDERPIDGMSILQIIEDKTDKRSKPIPFVFSGNHFDSTGATVIDGDFKFCTNLTGGGEMMFNIVEDRAEDNNIIEKYPEKATVMRKIMKEFLMSAKNSHSGADYNDSNFKPVDPWCNLTESNGKKSSKKNRKKNRKKKGNS